VGSAVGRPAPPRPGRPRRLAAGRDLDRSAHPAPSVAARTDGLTAVVIAVVVAETVVLVVLAVLVVGLLRSHAEILRRLHALDGGGSGEGETGSRAGSVAGYRLRDGVPAPAARPPGRGAVDVVGTGRGGELATVGVTGVAHDTLLAF